MAALTIKRRKHNKKRRITYNVLLRLIGDDKKHLLGEDVGPPHLALNPPYFFCFFYVFCLEGLSGPKPSLFFFVCFFFLSFLCFPPRKGHFLFIFECLPLFLLSLFWPPPLSIFLSLSLSSSCPFFLPSCLSFLFFFVSLFLSLYFLVFLLCFSFMKSTTSKYSITKLSFINIFSFLVSCLLFSLRSLFLVFVFC